MAKKQVFRVLCVSLLGLTACRESEPVQPVVHAPLAEERVEPVVIAQPVPAGAVAEVEVMERAEAVVAEHPEAVVAEHPEAPEIAAPEAEEVAPVEVIVVRQEEIASPVMVPLREAAASAGEDDPAGEANTLALGLADDGGDFSLEPGEMLLLRLEGNPSTGYIWTVRGYDRSVLVLEGHNYESGKPSMPGSGGVFTFHFRARAAGETRLSLAYSRAWETEEAPARTFGVGLRVE